MRQRQTGFTLVELVITLAIVAILISIAAPSFRDALRNARLTSVTNDIVVGVQMARAESIKRNRQVTICPISDPATSPPVCATGTSGTPAWRYGWIVFQDDTTVAAGTARPAASDVVVKYDTFRTTRTEATGVNVSSSNITAISTTNSDLSTASLSMQPFNLKSTQGTITLCDVRGASSGRQINVDALGRPTICSYDATTCPLVCP